MSVLLMALGLLLFFGLVVAHEWGHFVMARRGGVEVEEFGIGFPPRLFKKRTKVAGYFRLTCYHSADSLSLRASMMWTSSRIALARLASEQRQKLWQPV